jgi:hypothetical protein
VRELTKQEHFAEQQIIGYLACRYGDSMSDLFRSMGLTKKEALRLSEEPHNGEVKAYLIEYIKTQESE